MNQMEVTRPVKLKECKYCGAVNLGKGPVHGKGQVCNRDAKV